MQAQGRTTGRANKHQTHRALGQPGEASHTARRDACHCTTVTQAPRKRCRFQRNSYFHRHTEALRPQHNRSRGPLRPSPSCPSLDAESQGHGESGGSPAELFPVGVHPQRCHGTPRPVPRDCHPTGMHALSRYTEWAQRHWRCPFALKLPNDNPSPPKRV